MYIVCEVLYTRWYVRHVNKLMTSATYIFIFGICKLSIYFYIHMRFCMVGEFRVGIGKKKLSYVLQMGFINIRVLGGWYILLKYWLCYRVWREVLFRKHALRFCWRYDCKLLRSVLQHYNILYDIIEIEYVLFRCCSS